MGEYSVKLTKNYLKQIIKEELKKVMKEAPYDDDGNYVPFDRRLNQSQTDFATMVSDFFDKSESDDFDYDKEIEPILARMEKDDFKNVTTAELMDEYIAVCKEVKGKISADKLDRLKNVLKKNVGLEDWAIKMIL
jgi:hypothetical protein